MFFLFVYIKIYVMVVLVGLVIILVFVLMGYFIWGKIVLEKKNFLNRLFIVIYMFVLK